MDAYRLSKEDVQNLGAASTFMDSEFSKITVSFLQFSEVTWIKGSETDGTQKTTKPVALTMTEEDLVLDGCGVFLSGKNEHILN